MTIDKLREIVRAKDFLLLRQGRCVIKDAPDREHLLRMPKPEKNCPVEEVFYRKAGIR